MDFSLRETEIGVTKFTLYSHSHCEDARKVRFKTGRSVKSHRLGTTDQVSDDEVLSSGRSREGRGWFWEMLRRLGWHEGLYVVCCGKRENGLWCDWQVSDLVLAAWWCLSIKCYQEEALDKEQVWGRRWTPFWTSWIWGTCGWSRYGHPVDSWR